MASQDTPINTTGDGSVAVSAPVVDGTFGTPLKDEVDPNFSTPKRTPVRNRVLENLKGSQVAKSPALKIPESPAMKRLGYASGGGVYLLERSPRVGGALRSPWAIKKTKTVVVKKTNLDESQEASAGTIEIEYEAEILKKLSHPNIIGYRAFGRTSPGTAFLAMEKTSQSLSDLILEMRNEEGLALEDSVDGAPFPAAKIERVAVDVGKALTYLHEEAKMIHGDLKSMNVLVFGDFETIKLCDFGVARHLAKDGTVEGSYAGTEIWCPMEVIKANRGEEHAPITHKAEIFALGLTILEMITLQPPHLSSAEESCCFDITQNSVSSVGEGDSSFAEDSFDEDAFDEALARHVGTRPPLPDIEFDPSYTTILGIFYCCTEEDPLKRPDAKDVVTALTEADKKD